MVRRELIFICIIVAWMLMLATEIIFFTEIVAKYGVIISWLPILIMLGFIAPRFFSEKYNKWLETKVSFRKK